MIHFINPTIDCVFKAILGSESHEPVLIHFLNAMLNLSGAYKIDSVVLKNPYNAKDYLGAKDTIVDVKSTDNQGKRHSNIACCILGAMFIKRNCSRVGDIST